MPLIAGSEPMVTLLPTVTVPEMAGSEPMVTLLEMLAVTLPICAVPAGRAEPMVTVPEMGKGVDVDAVKNMSKLLLYQSGMDGNAVTPLALNAPSICTVPAIVCVPVGLAVTVPAIVTVLPTVTVPEMGRGLTELTSSY